ncbi:MAG: methionyl-tRNA formyltransferase [Candidatus Moranbacteria bacterium]|nr:methionyl-tRNA formyltransferase [Candidatus Moranbacteria bacterium]
MKLKDARIIFMGTSFFAKELLKNLIENNTKIELVITQPDKPAGRKKELKPSEVKILAQKNNLKLEQFTKLDAKALEKIKLIKPDLVIVAAYGMIIPSEMLTQPQYGFINIHTSLLPELRGSSPIQTSLRQGLKETGITIMKMDSGIDSGEIISQAPVTIDPQDTYPILEKKLTTTTNQVLIKTLDEYLEKKIIPQSQNSDQATYTRIIKKQDGKIDWSETSEKIYNQFRAFYNWPQVHTFWNRNGKHQKLTLTEIAQTDQIAKNKQIGEVYQKDDRVLVKTDQGSIILKKVQLEGKNNLTIKDFLNGNPTLIGNILK